MVGHVVVLVCAVEGQQIFEIQIPQTVMNSYIPCPYPYPYPYPCPCPWYVENKEKWRSAIETKKSKEEEWKEKKRKDGKWRVEKSVKE